MITSKFIYIFSLGPPLKSRIVYPKACLLPLLARLRGITNIICPNEIPNFLPYTCLLHFSVNSNSVTNVGPQTLRNLWHQNCQQVPWLYFQNISRLQPLLVLPPWCKLLSSFAWSFAVFSFLLYLPTSVLDPLESVSILQLQWSYQKQNQMIIWPWLNNHWWLQRSLGVKANVLFSLHDSALSGPPPLPRSHPGLLAVAWTCLRASTAEPLHSCFLCPHPSLPWELPDLLKSHFLIEQDFNFFDNNLILKEGST